VMDPDESAPTSAALVEEMLRAYDEQAAALRRTALGLYEMRLRSLAEEPNPVELIVSDSALRSRYLAMHNQVKHQIRSLVRPPYVMHPGPDVLNREIMLLSGGIRVQVIMGPELLDDAEILDATMRTIRAERKPGFCLLFL
jgi:hypothetical protein